MASSKEKVDRRTALKAIGAGIAGVVVGLAGGYAWGSTAAPAKTTTVTSTVTAPGAVTATTTVTAPGKTVTTTVTAPGTTVTKTVTPTVAVPKLAKIPLLPPGVRNPWLYEKCAGAKVKMMVDSFAGRIIEWYADL
ncbi:MAG TPA: hypothetical protein ENF33_02575, partial [Nitrososphaeria archaeon]|nr:hypothetical protein [Nitrososphaeria archaeon]